MGTLPVMAGIDFTVLWTWVLLFVRTTGMFHSLPGIGTDQVPESFRMIPSIALAAAITVSGVTAPFPETMGEAGAMVAAEFCLGFLLGAIPAFLIGGLAVAGHVIAGSIGLGQANMIDPSLGESISIISRIKTQVGVLIFLLLDGHHTVIRAVSTPIEGLAIGQFRPTMDTATLLIGRFISSFELAVVVAAPVLVTALITQFILGLITKFVPQVNIFIISLPLSVLVGLYIVAAGVHLMSGQLTSEVVLLDEQLQRIIISGTP